MNKYTYFKDDYVVNGIYYCGTCNLPLYIDVGYVVNRFCANKVCPKVKS